MKHELHPTLLRLDLDAFNGYLSAEFEGGFKMEGYRNEVHQPLTEIAQNAWVVELIGPDGSSIDVVECWLALDGVIDLQELLP